MPLFGKGKKKKILPFDSTAPNGVGQVNSPNPGEYPAEGPEIGLRRNTLGEFPASGHRAGGGTTIGPAERVALMRNLEFSAGGRSQLVATGPISPETATVSPRTGQVRISSTEGNDSNAGSAATDQPVQPPPHQDVGVSVRDGVAAEDRGNPTPDRRRDKEGI